MVAESLVIQYLVPLIILGRFKDSKIIIGAESFKNYLRKGNPKTSREFKNSIGKCIAWD